LCRRNGLKIVIDEFGYFRGSHLLPVDPLALEKSL